MNVTDINASITALHASPWLGVFAITGGGSAALPQLLSVPGASGTVAEAIIPYANAALAQWLKRIPDSYCSATTARAIAMAGFERAKDLEPPPEAKGFGFGLTASLASDRPKRGTHRFHCAIQTAATTATLSLTLNKGTRSRAEEEALTAEVAIAFLLDTLTPSASATHLDQVALQAGERPVLESIAGLDAWQRLATDELAAVVSPAGQPLAADGNRIWQAHTGAPSNWLIFPGSFDPLHAGHTAMATHAERVTQRTTTFEICIRNVDKPALDYHTIQERTRALPATNAVALTAAPTFVAKARLFPEAWFIVGIDTLVRIAEPRYYAPIADTETVMNLAAAQLAARDRALAELAASGARFLTFGRRTDSDFTTLRTVTLPSALRALCTEVPEADFRLDISSSALRAAANQAD